MWDQSAACPQGEEALALPFLRNYWCEPHNLYYSYVICFNGEGKQEKTGLFLVM